MNAIRAKIEQTQRGGQAMPGLRGGTRIHESDPLVGIEERSMGMAEDHQVGMMQFQQPSDMCGGEERIDDVVDQYSVAVEVQRFGVKVRQTGIVAIAEHRGNRGDRLELVDEGHRADVPRMNDPRDPAKEFEGARVQVTMSVGDEAYLHGRRG